MQCIRPLKASQRDDLSITFSPKESIPGLEAFLIQCRKCLPCRLNIAREKAIRSFHEAKEHEQNLFLTLTYNDENLKPRLDYKDFQDFMKRLRTTTSNKINYMVTGEYGEHTKRPHWHAIIFNYWPQDSKYHYTSDSGHQVYTSQHIADLWNQGFIEFGEVTLDSASYVARYAAKKLVHGKDQDHDYHPIHKTSSKRAIGRSWIEKNWKHTFENGFVYLPTGEKTKIPRYYVDWLKKYQPDDWLRYVTQVRPQIQNLAKINQQKEEQEYLKQLKNQRECTPSHESTPLPKKASKIKETILKQKFKKLQETLKL